MMETKSTFDNTVALIRYQPDANSFPQAPDLYQGLQGISSTTQILSVILRAGQEKGKALS
jgi:hypothetical protein